MKYNAITCYVCGSPYHRVRACPENQRRRNMFSTVLHMKSISKFTTDMELKYPK